MLTQWKQRSFTYVRKGCRQLGLGNSSVWKLKDAMKKKAGPFLFCSIILNNGSCSSGVAPAFQATVRRKQKWQPQGISTCMSHWPERVPWAPLVKMESEKNQLFVLELSKWKKVSEKKLEWVQESTNSICHTRKLLRHIFRTQSFSICCLFLQCCPNNIPSSLLDIPLFI